MANMELVIKIPEEQYNVIKSDLYNTFSAEMKEWGLEAIRNGTSLPKGHGRLIDENDIEWARHQEERNYIDYYVVDWEDIRKAPTIIEADKGE